MAYPEPKPGLVIHYTYLWRDQHRRGKEEGLKHRPCLISNVYLDKAGQQRVGVMPITHSHQPHPEYTVELPWKVTQYLGLDDERQWVVTREFNDFIWPGADLVSISKGKHKGQFAYGEVPAKLFIKARDQQLELARRQQLARIPRDFNVRSEMEKLRTAVKSKPSKSPQDKDPT